MFGLFKKKSAPPPPPAAPQSGPQAGAGIAFHPELIGELVADHRRLFSVFQSIQSSYDLRDFNAVAGYLDQFGNMLRNHLLTENMRLYIYLQQQAEGNEINSELIRNFRKEMDGIAKTALDFLKKYAQIHTRPELALAFGDELKALGKVLVDRTQKEESLLYPLYVPRY